MSKTKTKNMARPDRPGMPNPTTQILENVELLVAMYKEQGQVFSVPTESFDSTAIEKAVQEAIATSFNQTVAEAVQMAVSEALSGALGNVVDDRFNRFSDSLTSLNASFEAINGRLDGLDQVSDLRSDLTEAVSNFNDKFGSLERTFQDQCKTVNGFVAKFGTAGVAETKVDADEVVDSVDSVEPSPTGDNSTSHWGQQKQAMLMESGGDSEYRPLEGPADAESGSTPPSNESAANKEEEIEQLKRDLEAKLREAEVEVSIGRARLSQERVELERKQADLNRRTAALEAKLAKKLGDDDGEGNGDMMDRFKRHLGS